MSDGLPPHHGALFGPEGRIPQVNRVAVTRVSGLAVLRGGWRVTHTVLLALLSPLVFAVYRAAAGSSAGGVAMVTHAVAAVLGSLILVTYLPQPRTDRSTTACGAVPALMVVLAGIALNTSVFPGGEAAALAALGFGLWQRLSGFSTCGVTSGGSSTPPSRSA